MEGLASGEEMERALLELGPLLGVAVKEEAPDEPGDAAAQQLESSSSTPRAEVAKPVEGADSAGSPPSTTPSPPRCVLCRADLASQPGTPRLMDCLHSACEPCLRARQDVRPDKDFLGAERVIVTCPECQLPCNPANMIEQRFIIEKIARDQSGIGNSSSQMCSSCEEPEPATSYCVECAEYICDRCVSAHQRLKITKDHSIRRKEDADRAAPMQPGLFCTVHPSERLALFCETCERLTCRDCQLAQHRDHRHQFAHEMAAAARQTVHALLSEVAYKRVLLASAMQVIHERQQLIADKKRALVHDITQAVVRLTNAINSRGKQLVLRLGQVCDAKQRTLSEKKEALERLASVTDHCVNFVTSALEGSDAALLYSKRVVTSHLQRVKARRADIPNPEIPVRIQLQLDKLPELIRVVSSIGAIVVDGKVDGGGGAGGGGGGGGGAQGPYHPPPHPPPLHHPAPPQHQHQHQPPTLSPAHSAVMALQHHAMQQSGCGGGGVAVVSGGGGGGMTPTGRAPRHPMHTPLRHPHVTSTTHPHHLQGMNEMNLRGLLSPLGRGAVMGGGGGGGGRQHPSQQQHAAMQQIYQQMLGAGYAGGYAAVPSGRRSAGAVGARTPSPAPPHLPLYHPPQQQAPAPAPAPAPAQQHAMAMAKWHIPQQSLPNGNFEPTSPTAVDFKIQLGRAGAVTSTNPEPPPGVTGGGGADLDRLCADSVRDLMATIAKLDSNGVQVVCEAPASASPLPAVHSTAPSPGAVGALGAATGAAVGSAGATGAEGDPNEDWCAVCMDGGQLMCCDKCPKVFHQYCHIPTIDKLPDETETWQCLLCVNFAELPPDAGGASGGGLTPRERKLVERLTLELYCQYEPSLPFREPVAPDNVDYHSKISTPMCLDMIRARLQRGAAGSPGGYQSVAEFVADVRLIFTNAYAYNPPDSQIYKDAQRLEEFFESALAKWAPEHCSQWSHADGALDGGPSDVKRPRLQ